MSAVEKAARLVRDMGADEWVACPCGGGWAYEAGECFAATHTTDCPYRDGNPPKRPRAASSGGTENT